MLILFMELNTIDSIEPQPKINFLKKPSRKFLIISLIILTLLLISSICVSAYFYQIIKTNNLSANTITKTLTPTPTPLPIIDNSQKNYFGAITWLDKPQKISPPVVFTKKTDFEIDEVSTLYFSKINSYLVANFEDGSQLINLFLPSISLDHEIDNIYRFIKSPDGKLSILSSDNIDQIKDYLLSEVSIIKLTIKDFDPPEIIIIDDISFTKNYFTNRNFDSLSNPKLVGVTEFGNLYAEYSSRNDFKNIYYQDFYLRLKDGTLYSYDSSFSFINDDKTTKIQWLDNSNVKDQFTFNISSSDICGYNGKINIIKNDSTLLDNIVTVGTYNEKTFYQIKDINNNFLKKLYEDYHMYISKYGDINEFANDKNHFLYQNSLGDWVIFVNQSYTVQAECGKPVIYLYPKTDTQVKVQVDAKITKSEPEYPQQGWDVTAKPDGELIYQNQSYPYLFWEGLGNGIYPDYKDRGFVVSQKDLVSTLYSQLSQLGLNQKESADFMEFWQSKLPTTPYVRLTWLTTQDMNNLAPLYVSPKPDTQIRIFLEFEGLDQPITLKPQKLNAPSRNGFTLIEWGGLLLKYF